MNVYTVSRYLRGHEPAVRPPDWTEFALCAEVDNALFFPEKGEPSASAKAVCRGCEVRAECLGFALENMERYGVWGGFSERERRSIAPRHHAGRSLEDIIAADDARFYAKKEKSAELAAAATARQVAARAKRQGAAEPSAPQSEGCAA